jgi:hypothetical protein
VSATEGTEISATKDTQITKGWIGPAAAAAFLGAAIYHLAAMLIPRFAAAAYPSGYPLWRHLLFIAINVSMAWLLLKQVRWVVWLVALMTIQIYSGHGRLAWTMWTRESRVAWVDLLTTIGASVFLLLLIAARPRSVSQGERSPDGAGIPQAR